MMKTRCTALLLLIGLALSPVVLAQSNLAGKLENCRLEQNALKRLVCYDEIELNINKGPASPAAAAAVAATANNSAKAEAKIERPTASSNFGIEHRQAITEASDEQTAVVAGIRLSPRREMIIELDNGQIWRQNGSEAFDLKAGEQISIKRGMFGAFYLSKAGLNRTIKVTRSN